MTEETIKTVPLDRAKLEPIVKLALENGRMISTEGMEKVIWLGLRVVLGLGGSDVSPALGISKYKTAYQLWLEKVADEIESFENKFTIWGNLLEEPLSQEYMRQTRNVIVEDKKIRIHPEHNNLFVNLDRIVMQDGIPVGIVEIKSTVNRVFKSWQKDDDYCVDGIPLYFYCQIQHELSVSGLPWCDLVIGIIDEREIVIKRIERDEEYIQKQNKALVMWWNAYVLTNEAPPKTAAEWSFEDPMSESLIEASGEIAEIYANLKGKKDTSKALKKEIDDDQDKIKEFMGDKENLVLSDKIICSWKMQKRTAIDSKKLKAERPELFDEFSKTSSSRVFRVKEIN